MMVFTLAQKELRSLFYSPLGWSLLGVVQFILGYMFLVHVEAFIQIQPQLLGMEGAPGVTGSVVLPLFGDAATILLLVAPLITMRLISEERRNQTLPLLFSAPLSMSEIILGKYLGVVGFLGIMVLLLLLMPLSLLLGGSLDFGLLGAQTIGLMLMLASFAAIGLFMSSLTSYPTVAAIATFGALLLLWIIDWAGNSAGTGLFSYLSLMRHFEPFLRGNVNSSDLLYYLLLITCFLVLSIRRLDADRIN